MMDAPQRPSKVDPKYTSGRNNAIIDKIDPESESELNETNCQNIVVDKKIGLQV